LSASATDTDSGSATLDRTRTLTTTATDGDSGTGTLTTQTSLTFAGQATDTDSATATLTATRDLSASAIDADSATATLDRSRSLTTTATDPDPATATLRVKGTLEAAGSDTTSGTGTLFETFNLEADGADTTHATADLRRTYLTTEVDPVDATIDILRTASGAAWTNGEPDVFHHDEIPFSEKGPGGGQNAQIYVWAPTDATLGELSAAGEYIDKTHVVEIQVWSLDRDVTQYRRDILDIMGRVINNQQRNGEFITFSPTASRDYRADKAARQTDHYINTVQIDPRKLDSV
jgi:hypothetical protein